MDHTSATTTPDLAAQASTPAQQSHEQAASQAAAPPDLKTVGFAERGRMRRRARFLRKARELAYRDLGGLVFSLHSFGQRNDALVLAKLDTLRGIDAELRALEAALSERQPVTVLREAGITACPRCAAIHSGEDRFCPNCGLPDSGHVELPSVGQAAARATGTPASAGPATGAPGTAPTAAGTPASASPATGAPATASPATASPANAAPAYAAPSTGTDRPAADVHATPADDGEQPTRIVRPPALASWPAPSRAPKADK